MRLKNNKIKIALICHFSNEFVQGKLKLRKKVNEFAPWISVTIQGIKRHPEIELHIISPHDYLISDSYFVDQNIHYHFFTIGVPFIHRHWPSFFRFDLWTKYNRNRKKIKKLINQINPDIVHLYGAENAYYSSSILDLLHFKHLVSIQGFVYKEVKPQDSNLQQYRVQIEREIFSKADNFGIECSYMIDEIKKVNSTAKFLWHRIPVILPMQVQKQEPFDIVFFGRITKEKGIEDFIYVIGQLVKKHPKLKVKILGSVNLQYQSHLKYLAAEYNCFSNIEFTGFIPVHSELYNIISGAKLYIFPTYNDTIPGTIIEALSLGISIVSYDTGGIPDLNRDAMVLELVRQGDLIELTQKSSKLLEDDSLRNSLQKNGLEFVKLNYYNDKPVSELVDVYKKILRY